MDLQKLEVPKSQTENGETELKAFTFRNIPLTLHKAWKTCAALSGISMEEFALHALQEHIKKMAEQQHSA